MWYYNTNLKYGLDTFIVPFDPEKHGIDQYQGFVYVIVEKTTGKKYIGKKFFWKPKILPKTKTRKRRVRTVMESDWKIYFGSSKEVQSLVEQNGEDNYKRIILKLCKTKGECSYYEMKYQLEYDVLLKPDEYYNAFVGGKIHRNHILGLQDPEDDIE
jgi:hypothetical protein